MHADLVEARMREELIEDMTEPQLDALWAQVNAQTSNAPSRRARRALPVRRTLLIAAVIATLTAGMAVAADVGAPWTWFADAPVREHVGALDRPAEPNRQLSEADAREMIPPRGFPESVGVADPRWRGRLLIEHETERGTIHVNALGTRRGNVCVGYSIDRGRGLGPEEGMTACGMKFEAGWPITMMSSDLGTARGVYFGIAADDVRSVRFERENGKLEAALRGTNSYLWIPGPDEYLAAVEVELRNGTVLRREYPGERRQHEQMRSRADRASQCHIDRIPMERCDMGNLDEHLPGPSRPYVVEAP